MPGPGGLVAASCRPASSLNWPVATAPPQPLLLGCSTSSWALELILQNDRHGQRPLRWDWRLRDSREPCCCLP